MSKNDIVAVGESFEDFVFVDLPHFPEPGREIKTNSFIRTVGGGVIITTIAAARLGIKCQVISGLSPRSAQKLQDEGIAVRNLKTPDEPFAISVAISTPEDRSFITYNGINNQLEERLFEPTRQIDASHVHLALCPADCSRWIDVVQDLSKRGITTSWDFGWNEQLVDESDFRKLLKAVDFLFVNELEARLYSGHNTLSKAETFWRQNTKNTILKIGPQGSRWLTREFLIEAPPVKVEAQDTTGAGDAFNGGFLTGIIRKFRPNQCLELGNLVGGLSTRSAGGIDSLPKQEEML